MLPGQAREQTRNIVHTVKCSESAYMHIISYNDIHNWSSALLYFDAVKLLHEYNMLTVVVGRIADAKSRYRDRMMEDS